MFLSIHFAFSWYVDDFAWLNGSQGTQIDAIMKTEDRELFSQVVPCRK